MLKGCNAEQKKERLDAVGGRPYKLLEIPDGPSDIPAYYHAAEQTKYDVYCFTNSFSLIQVGDWLCKLASALASSEVIGAVNGSASWEQNNLESNFPNYHLRTNGFMISRELFLSLDRGDLSTRAGALAFEAGQNSMTKQIMDRGLEPLVVDKAGKLWRKEDWPQSNTFRAGNQSELMIADNRTKVYETADGVLRIYLEKMAWTDLDPGPNPMKRHKFSYKFKKLIHFIRGKNKKRFSL